MEKFEKNTNCAYCQKTLEAKYRSKKFCNDKCRIYFNREEKKQKAAIFKKFPPEDDTAVLNQEKLFDDIRESRLPKEGYDKSVIKHSLADDFKAWKEELENKAIHIPIIPEKLPGEPSLDYKLRIAELNEKHKINKP